MQATGRVERKQVAQGSKSERNAVVLKTSKGEYVLQRAGGHPFHDDVLDELVGSQVTFEGAIMGNTLIVRDWNVVGPKAAR
jgi:hypothetical protein